MQKYEKKKETGAGSQEDESKNVGREKMQNGILQAKFCGGVHQSVLNYWVGCKYFY